MDGYNQPINHHVKAAHASRAKLTHTDTSVQVCLCTCIGVPVHVRRGVPRGPAKTAVQLLTNQPARYTQCPAQACKQSSAAANDTAHAAVVNTYVCAAEGCLCTLHCTESNHVAHATLASRQPDRIQRVCCAVLRHDVQF